MLEETYFTVSYTPVADIRSLCIIISISSAEGLILFDLDIYNDFQNTISPNPTEIVYLILPYLYLDFNKENGQNIHCPQVISENYSYKQSSRFKAQNLLELFDMAY